MKSDRSFLRGAIVCLLLAVLLLGMGILVDNQTIAEEEFKYGDVDGDGKITVSDAILVLRDIVGLTELKEDQMERADVAGNNEINVEDAILILRKIVGLVDQFPAEIWDPELLFHVEEGERIDSLAYSPDGDTIALGADALKLFSVAAGEVIYCEEDKEYQERLETDGMDYSPDGSMLALVGGGNDGIYNAKDLTEIQPLQGYQTNVVFSTDGERLATARWSQATVRLLEAENGGDFEEVEVYEDDSDFVNDVAFSPDGKYLAAGFYDGKVHLFDVENRELADTIEFEDSGATVPLSFSPDGEILAVKAPDIVDKIYFFNLNDGSTEMELPTPTGLIHAMDYSPDGDYFAYGGSGGVVIYDTGDWSQPLYLLEHEEWVRELSFSPDGEKLAVGTDEGFYLYHD